MNQPDTEALVRMIADGHNTWKDIHGEFPWLSDMEMIGMSVPPYGGPNKIVHSEVHIDPFDISRFRFSELDTFSLTENGEDILYRLYKEDENRSMNKKILRLTAGSFALSAISFLYSLIR